jgi:purine nucleosidase
VGIQHTTANAARILDWLDLPAKLYRGADRPLLFASADAAYVHGRDGLGDIGYPASARAVEALPAAMALVDYANRAPGAYTLVALGPLTNIALALRLDPELPQKLRRLVIMGGAVTGRGNTPNVGAEFNFFADPEAAHLVLRDWGGKAGEGVPPPLLVDWELVCRHAFSAARVTELRSIETRLGRVYAAISQKVIDFVHSERGETGLAMADPAAVVALLEPGAITRSERHAVEVVLSGTHARGMSLVDWQDRSGLNSQLEIVMALDQTRFETAVRRGLAAR